MGAIPFSHFCKYHSRETVRLLRSPKNAKRLRESVAEIEAEIARRKR